MKTITFKVSDDEARMIRSRARKAKLSISEFLRRQARSFDAEVQFPKKNRCPHTGAMIFASPVNEPPLNNESVRELLSDFP